MAPTTLFLGTLAICAFIAYAGLNYGRRSKDMPHGKFIHHEKNAVTKFESHSTSTWTGPGTLPFIGNLHQLPTSYTHVK